MGALKDCVDLIEKLDKSIKDRKTLNILFPIKEKLHQAAVEQLALEREIFNTERDLKSEIDNLKTKHREETECLKADYSEKMSKLQAENQKLKSELERKSKPSGNRRLVRG